MLIGYARISTRGQNLDRQRNLLGEQGCEKIYEETRTGVDRKRPRLEALIEAATEGDIVLVTSLDRLARSTHDLFEITKKLDAKDVGFRSLRAIARHFNVGVATIDRIKRSIPPA